MKKLILLVCFLLVSSFGYSQLLTENFDYTAGTLITDNGWTAISAGGTNPILVSNPGLTFPSYVGSGIGNAATLQSLGGEDDRKNFTSNQTSGSVYASFMLNLTAANGSGDYFAALRSISGSLNARVYAAPSGGGYNLGLGNTGSGLVPVYAPDVFSLGTTYLVVVKYEFVGGVNDDLLSLFVFSTAAPSTEPTPLIGPTHITNMSDATDLDAFTVRQGSSTNSPALVIDGIYVDNSWNNGVLPVELASFTSSVSNRDVTLNWSTATETNNSGFEVERAVNNVWSKVGNVAGNGTTVTANSYSFTDRGLATGTYSYRLKQIDFNGNFEYFNLNNEVNIGTPNNYALSQNYPNPFNPSTSINFDIPTDGKVSIRLFDMSGKEVAVLVNEVKTAGYYSVNFNASSLSSGVYFYSISADNFTATKKMLLVK